MAPDCLQRERETYIYICAVDLKTGPILPFLVLKTGPFFVIFVFEDLVLPAERRGFLQKKKQKQKKTHF